MLKDNRFYVFTLQSFNIVLLEEGISHIEQIFLIPFIFNNRFEKNIDNLLE
jgi:hypothetical protein